MDVEKRPGPGVWFNGFRDRSKYVNTSINFKSWLIIDIA